DERMTPRQLRKNCSMEALASVENLFLATAGARRNKTRSRENGKSPGSLIELFFKRFRVRSQRVKFVLRQKPDVWQHNFFGLRQLTHSRIHKALKNTFQIACNKPVVRGPPLLFFFLAF